MTAELERDHPKTFPLLFNDKQDDPERRSILRKSEPINVLIPLSPTVVDRILEEPWCSPLILPEFPSGVRRIWIYETKPVDAVSMMIHYNNNHLPVRLYQSLNPLQSKEFHGKLRISPHTQPQYAPLSLLLNQHSFMQKIWNDTITKT